MTNQPSPTIAVIMDLDGVIADTERMWVPIWERVARQRGKVVPREQLTATAGVANRQIAELLFADCSIPERQAALAEANALGRAEVEREVRLCPGVGDFLTRCRGQPAIRLALATNSGSRYVHDLLPRLGLAGWFDPVVCGEGRYRPKPEPDIYLAVRELVALPAERCLVFEDSKVGIRSAQAAGLRVVGVAGTFPAVELHGLADTVLCNWSEADGLLPWPTGMGWSRKATGQNQDSCVQ